MTYELGCAGPEPPEVEAVVPELEHAARDSATTDAIPTAAS